MSNVFQAWLPMYVNWNYFPTSTALMYLVFFSSVLFPVTQQPRVLRGNIATAGLTIGFGMSPCSLGSNSLVLMLYSNIHFHRAGFGKQR
jgi:hypothetical protein